MAKKVAYLGPAGTFSEAATLAHDPTAELVACISVAAAVATVEAGGANEAVVAIENSIEGSVTETLDVLIHETQLAICKELVLPIEQCLLARPGAATEDVRIVFSHPQALGQCRHFMEQHMSRVQTVAALSTVAAIDEMLAHDGPAAAIAPKRAAQLFPVVTLAEGIQDHPDNVTRFVVLAAKDHPLTGDDKTSIAFWFHEDTPRQVYLAIKGFAERDINLSKIESRPAKESLGKYVFLLDFNRHREDDDARAAIREMTPLTSMLKILGSYPRFRSGS